MKENWKGIKGVAKVALITYTILGSCYMFGQNTTGHISADIFQREQNKLEMTADKPTQDLTLNLR